VHDKHTENSEISCCFCKKKVGQKRNVGSTLHKCKSKASYASHKVNTIIHVNRSDDDDDGDDDGDDKDDDDDDNEYDNNDDSTFFFQTC
jgi:hypothetical protein